MTEVSEIKKNYDKYLDLNVVQNNANLLQITIIDQIFQRGNNRTRLLARLRHDEGLLNCERMLKFTHWQKSTTACPLRSRHHVKVQRLVLNYFLFAIQTNQLLTSNGLCPNQPENIDRTLIEKTSVTNHGSGVTKTFQIRWNILASAETLIYQTVHGALPEQRSKRM